MSRLREWVESLKKEGMSEYMIASGLGNGEIKRPEWLGSGMTSIGFAVWDTANSSGDKNLFELDTDGYDGHDDGYNGDDDDDDECDLDWK